MSKPRIAIFASGAGTTAEVVMQAAATGALNAEVVLVIANHPSPGVFERVRGCNSTHGTHTTTHYIGSKNYPPTAHEAWQPGRQTVAEEAAILDTLAQNNIDFVALLGYMKLVGPRIVERYGYSPGSASPFAARMANTHPGILPDTKGYYGIHVQEFVLATGAPAGHCVFAVDAEYDGGPVVAEHRVDTQPGDTPETLFQRVQASEKATIAHDIGLFLQEDIGN